MRTVTLTLLSFVSLQAADFGISLGGYFPTVIAAAAALLFFILFVLRRNEVERLKKTLEEKEEKIEWLRRIKGENEYRLDRRIRELEKETETLRSEISELERKLREGTKNQVVARLDSLRRKREEAMKKAGAEV
jgi:C4-dicarboxylate-specific signal transduction histidine kinase